MTRGAASIGLVSVTRLYVFEGPIDLLSYITLYPEDWQQHSYVACCGTSSLPVLWMLEHNPGLRDVSLCLDNDKAGHTASLRLAEQIAEQFEIASSRLIPENKDWNDDLTKTGRTGSCCTDGPANGVSHDDRIDHSPFDHGRRFFADCHCFSHNRPGKSGPHQIKTVGDGQHGTARWASKKEIQQTFKHIPFRPEVWRKGKDLPTDQGLVLGCVSGPSVGSLRTKIFKQKTNDSKHPAIQALVDTDDIHCLMIGASGIGKTAFFLYPNLEYACACGMSFLAAGYQGRSGAKLRNHRRSVLRLSGGGHRPAESHSIRRIQSADSHQSLHGYLPGEF